MTQNKTNGRRQLRSFILVVVLLGSALIVRMWHDHVSHSVHRPSFTQNIGNAAGSLSGGTSLVSYGNYFLQHGNLSGAMGAFSRAAHMNPSGASAYLGLAAVAMRTGHYQIALANLHQAVIYEPNHAEIWHVIGDVEARLNRQNSAIAAYQRCLKTDSKDEVGWRQLGILESRELNYPLGKLALQKAVILAPNDVLAQDSLAANALAQGQLSVAQAAYRTVLQDNPNEPEALAGMADVEMQLNPSATGLANAQSLVKKSLEIRPSAFTHLISGHIFLIGHQYKCAISEFAAAMKGEKDNQSLWLWLAQAYTATGHRALARDATVKALNVRRESSASVAELRPGGR